MDAPTPTPAAETLNRDGLWAMPAGPPHEEHHLSRNEVVRDLVAGAADGLVLPFALVAGLSVAAASQPLIIMVGFVAAAVGGIATGLGGFLAARDEAEHYLAERLREEEETIDYADRERWEVAAILHRYGVRGDALRLAVDSICADKRRWVDFMMRFELDLKEPEPRRVARSAMTIGGATVLGGLVPLAPFMLAGGSPAALAVSCAITAVALAGLGWLRSRAAGLPPLRGAIQTLALGGVAAAVACLAAKAAGG